MSVRAFYEKKSDILTESSNVTYGGGRMTVGVTASLSKSALGDEDLILLTCCYAAHDGGIMPYENYTALRTQFIMTNSSCVFRTTVDNTLSEIDRIEGKNSGEKVIADVKRDLMSIHEVRDIVYARVVEPFLRITSSDPDLIFLKSLCEKLPRHVTPAKRVSPF